MNIEHDLNKIHINGSVTLNKYLRRDIYSVNGYLKSLDAKLIAEIATCQTSEGISAALAEIGVHHGKLFFILALSRQLGEGALAIDLFEDDDLNKAARFSGRSRAFIKHAERLKIKISSNEIFKGDSLTLEQSNIVSRVGNVRIFSVDGGHLYHHLAHDLPLAASVLDARGIIIVDDFCNAQWPDVTAATFDFLTNRKDDFTPVIITNNKLYVAHHNMAPFYKKIAQDFSKKHKSVRSEVVEVKKEKLPYLSDALTVRVTDALLSKFSKRF